MGSNARAADGNTQHKELAIELRCEGRERDGQCSDEDKDLPFGSTHTQTNTDITGGSKTHYYKQADQLMPGGFRILPRSKIQEVILRRRSRSMNSAGAQRSHVPDQAASSSTVPSDGDGGGAGADAAGSKSAAARALFASPRLLHSSSLPAGTFAFVKSPRAGCRVRDVLLHEPDVRARRGGGLRARSGRRRQAPPAVAGAGQQRPRGRAGLQRPPPPAAAGADRARGDVVVLAGQVVLPGPPRRVRRQEQELVAAPQHLQRPRGYVAGAGRSAGDNRNVVGGLHVRHLRGPNPRTVHIFGDRVVEGGASAGAASERESSPRPINLPPRGDRGFFSL
ncbi:unnamed protein product [Miscanthus lutarioriparius]|uniref:Uncharacterized protein n=1 Tax=Miscanthus lutarioriparius TaxID=422564 RepID=A0A811SIA2_9POAL|nr:unnamed protein product [Miscanthus lutarioriparius]